MAHAHCVSSPRTPAAPASTATTSGGSCGCRRGRRSSGCIVDGATQFSQFFLQCLAATDRVQQFQPYQLAQALAHAVCLDGAVLQRAGRQRVLQRLAVPVVDHMGASCTNCSPLRRVPLRPAAGSWHWTDGSQPGAGERLLGDSPGSGMASSASPALAMAPVAAFLRVACACWSIRKLRNVVSSSERKRPRFGSAPAYQPCSRKRAKNSWVRSSASPGKWPCRRMKASTGGR